MMKIEVFVSVIAFHLNSERKVSLLLLNNNDHLCLPRGIIKKGERLQQSAIRILKEQTNLDLLIITLEPLFENKEIVFQDNYEYKKIVYFFAGFINSKIEDKYSTKTQNYNWSSFRGGIAKTTYIEDKNAIKQARKWVESDNSTTIFMARNLSLIR